MGVQETQMGLCGYLLSTLADGYAQKQAASHWVMLSNYNPAYLIPSLGTTDMVVSFLLPRDITICVNIKGN